MRTINKQRWPFARKSNTSKPRKEVIMLTILKKLGFALVLVALLVIAASTLVSAAPPTPSGPTGYFTYSAGFQVQNLSASVATIAATYYKPDGTVQATVPDTISANGSKTYYPLSAVPSGYSGSVVLTSDQPVAAIVNVLGNGGVAGASYTAMSAGSSPVSLPVLMKGNYGFNTWFNVQNTSTSAANVTVTYSDSGALAPVTIQPGAAHTFLQASETHSAKVFSGVVTSSQPVAVAVMEEDPKTLFAYSGFPSSAATTNPVMPLVNANNFGFVTGIQIQNTGGSSTNVTVSYTPSLAGTACTETQTVPSNQSVSFALYAFTYSPRPAGDTTNCTLGQKFVGSAKVTANSASQNLVVNVNQLYPGVKGEAYGGFNPSLGTRKVVFPLIMDRNYGYNTGLNVMNVNSSGSTTVTCTFSGSSYTASATLAPGQSLSDYEGGKIANGYVGSATCTASNVSDKIVGTVNELGSGTGDQFLVYEGINQ